MPSSPPWVRRLVQQPPPYGEVTDDSTCTTPAEFEAPYYRQGNPAAPEAGTR